jgi:bifunctional UDP-N-acetylglucosamine pyrophosphorylase/glucosamine-1-phosphate N-acetyltransferase
MSDVHVVILAAGKGTRMKSAHPKVLHRVAGLPMIQYVLGVASRLAPKTTTIVVGYGSEAVKKALTEPRRDTVGVPGASGLRFVTQEPQLGTAHALLTAEPLLNGARGEVVLLSGDVPLLSIETLTQLVDRHATQRAAATVVTALVDNPRGYGRIVRSGDRIARIVEEKDATPAEREIREINSGIYAFALEGLFESVRSIPAANAQQEHYLPDLVDMYRRLGRTVETVTVSDADEIRGINSRAELAEMSRIVRQKKNAALMAAGVTLEDPATTYIDQDVEIGADTVIHPGVAIEGQTRIGAACEIHSGVRIADSQLGDRVKVYNHCVITNARIDNDAGIGPFAHLRNEATVGPRAKVGNFVEMKKTVLGPASKAMHLAYLGDAVTGGDVNIGAGTITCNYDGTTKSTTTIEAGAFIGSDTQLIAPVTVGKGAYVGTGTTIRENVPAGALAVSAGKQRNIEGWVEKKLKSQK